MINPIAQLQLRDYSLLLLTVEANPDFIYDQGKPIPSKFGVNFDFYKKNNEHNFKIILDVMVNLNDGDFKKSEYRIRVKLESYFEFDKTIAEHDIPKLIIPNGLAMTYSTARGIVGQATGTAMHGKYLLPSVNFIELIKEKFEREKRNKDIKITPKKKLKHH
jgi:preprotein translocase subunit SecB